MADTFTLATELAVLIAGRRPSWRAQTVSDSVENLPDELTDGAYLEDAPRTWFGVSLRENSRYRTARLTIPSLNIGDTFTTTINGTGVAYDSTGDANLDEVVAGIAAAINADGTVGALVTALAVNSDDDTTTSGTRDSVRITGDTDADYSINFSRGGGSSTIACVADAVACTVRVYGLPLAAEGSTAPGRWRKLQTSYAITVPGGLLEALSTAGIERLFVQTDSLSKHGSDGSMVTLAEPDIDIGPCILET